MEGPWKNQKKKYRGRRKAMGRKGGRERMRMNCAESSSGNRE